MDMPSLYARLSMWIILFSPHDLKKNAAELNEYRAAYREIRVREQKRAIANLLADAYYKQAEGCANAFRIFESLDCVNDCRSLLADFPEEAHIALQLLQVITGLIFVKLHLSEDGMVEEYMDEVMEIAERFPVIPDIQRQAAMCMGNLIALCGSIDAPLSLAYAGAERMESMAQRLPRDPDLQNIYAHILVSVCCLAKNTHNEPRLTAFRKKLQAVQAEGVVNTKELRRHLSGVMLE